MSEEAGKSLGTKLVHRIVLTGATIITATVMTIALNTAWEKIKTFDETGVILEATQQSIIAEAKEVRALGDARDIVDANLTDRLIALEESIGTDAVPLYEVKEDITNRQMEQQMLPGFDASLRANIREHKSKK